MEKSEKGDRHSVHYGGHSLIKQLTLWDMQIVVLNSMYEK